MQRRRFSARSCVWWICFMSMQEKSSCVCLPGGLGVCVCAIVVIFAWRQCHLSVWELPQECHHFRNSLSLSPPPVSQATLVLSVPIIEASAVTLGDWKVTGGGREEESMRRWSESEIEGGSNRRVDFKGPLKCQCFALDKMSISPIGYHGGISFV